MASRSHRSPSGRRPTALASALAVAVAALVVALVLAFLPDRGSDADPTAATPAAGTQVTASPSAEKTPSKSASPSASASAGKSPSASATASASAAARKTPTRRAAATSAAHQAAAGAPLAGRIKPGVTYDGVATFYDVGNGDGACLYGPTSDTMTAAMNTADYETAKACGAYILVHSGGASVTVRITNECPAPCAPGQLDLSPQAFAKLADPTRGQIPITWSLLSPSTSDTISIRYKTGSSQYWCGIQAIGHRNPLARLEVRTGSGWLQLTREKFNYFLSEQGSGCGGDIRLTDIYGEQVQISGIGVKPDVVQSTRVQFAQH
ncbi:expansin EXLX1 family cellulose-binding protein [Streptomyces sp. NPDC047072]|uniref:expansin EXLX1 family cellulose-binding protein n=1 Tax=Streptomyces sp. NPDC047072 TaxID=3154809 RepID=UPI0034048936